jgi:hypothetical protein
MSLKNRGQYENLWKNERPWFRILIRVSNTGLDLDPQDKLNADPTEYETLDICVV